MTILDQIADHARERTAQAKLAVPLLEMKRQALSLPRENFAFEAALRRKGISFICECKQASPSKGVIAPEFPYLQIAKDYEAAGADCISVPGPGRVPPADCLRRLPPLPAEGFHGG